MSNLVFKFNGFYIIIDFMWWRWIINQNSLEISYDYTTGNPSSLEQANSNILLGSERNLPYDGPIFFFSKSLKFLSYPITLANNVWSSGWN